MKAPELDLSANVLLGALPESELDRLRKYFTIVPLALGTRLWAAGEPHDQLYFPLEGAISRLAQIPSGETVEVGIVGRDGLVGLPLALSGGAMPGGSAALTSARVQIAGHAAVISAADFDEHVRGANSPLAQVLLAYANLQLHIIANLTACHCLHRIEQRLSRCILELHDRAGKDDDVRITHDALADFLGVYRPSITYALQALASEGIIGAERRRLIVHDRVKLQARACECYTAMRDIQRRELRHIKRAARE